MYPFLHSKESVPVESYFITYLVWEKYFQCRNGHYTMLLWLGYCSFSDVIHLILNHFYDVLLLAPCFVWIFKLFFFFLLLRHLYINKVQEIPLVYSFIMEVFSLSCMYIGNRICMELVNFLYSTIWHTSYSPVFITFLGRGSSFLI